MTTTFGKDEGQRVSFHAPRVKVNTPTIGTDGAALTLDRTGTIMGTKTSIEDALFISQE